MKQKKMGALALSGFMIGPILGSGILLLPPIVYNIANDWAIVAWLSIIIVSLLVAFIFGYISIRFPGDGGAAIAIEHVFGRYMKRLASFYLIIGVVFGASAVLLTAGQYIKQLNGTSATLVSYVVLAVCTLLLLSRVNWLGKISFAVSIISASVLFSGSLNSLISHAEQVAITTSFDFFNFGYAILILFWAIFGWEIIGNYSADVMEPKKTITRAIIMSMVVISIVYLVVAAAMQWSRLSELAEDSLTITSVIYPLFGNASYYIMAILALFLCSSTYFLYIGGVARLVASMAKEKVLPATFGKRTSHEVPVTAILVISVLIIGVLAFVQAGIFHLAALVAFANSFLTINALMGILAGIVLIPNRFVKACGVLLAIFFISMLLIHSPLLPLIIIGGLGIYYGYKHITLKRKISAPVN